MAAAQRFPVAVDPVVTWLDVDRCDMELLRHPGG